MSFIQRIIVAAAVVVTLAVIFTPLASAHGVSSGDAKFVEANKGAAIAPFLYLGAKHMVTGYDNLLFLVGVIFFLYRLKDIVQYVTVFTIGHSVTLLAGVQALALTAVLIALSFWRTRPGYLQHAFITNTLLMAGGFIVMGYQITGYGVTQ